MKINSGLDGKETEFDIALEKYFAKKKGVKKKNLFR